jgi:hypothetical protein
MGARMNVVPTPTDACDDKPLEELLLSYFPSLSTLVETVKLYVVHVDFNLFSLRFLLLI